MNQMGKSVMRVAKNSIKGFSDTQTRVRDATSNDPWGPSGTQMSEIAALTFNQQDFVEIIEMLDKRLNDKGKNWRHVFKSLTLLDYCLHAGSENVVMYFRENLYIVKTLKEFQYVDEYGKDQGANVRQKAKEITSLLLDEGRMRSQRKTRKTMQDRMHGDGRPQSSMEDRESTSRPPPRRSQSGPPGDRDLEAAIAASKKSAEEEARKIKGNSGDADLEEAMRLSREEDERRRMELLMNGGGGLFDEQQQRGDQLIDLDSQPQQPMMTGVPFSSFNPYAMQQHAQTEEYMRQQMMMELQRQAEEQAQYQQMMQQQAFAQQQHMAQEEYMRQQAYQQQLAMQQQQQQPLVPQPTAFGANNPFAAFASPPSSSPAPQTNMSNTSHFNDNFKPSPSPTPAPTQQAVAPQRRAKVDDSKHSELARLLAGGNESGIDTFGNVGNMRVPVGQQFATRTGLQSQATGSRPNPFGSDFTGQQSISQQQRQSQQQQQQQSSNTPFFEI